MGDGGGLVIKKNPSWLYRGAVKTDNNCIVLVFEVAKQWRNPRKIQCWYLQKVDDHYSIRQKITQ